ncbi:MAG TPA: hypothetical protein DCW29_18175 [Janthinobacterium sp.]|nr:hypothetical protein [Janthinobacterium sp.]
MSAELASISFQYIDAGADEPTPSREFTDRSMSIPNRAHVPRIGEVVELTHWDTHRAMQVGAYMVLSVYTRVALFDGRTTTSGWHTTITVGPADELVDKRFLLMRS